uniref:small ribosomal subunit protein uS15m n=1 Tax=Myxine glutinosa TaxID=7769 RepID=UPI00358DE48F
MVLHAMFRIPGLALRGSLALRTGFNARGSIAHLVSVPIFLPRNDFPLAAGGWAVQASRTYARTRCKKLPPIPSQLDDLPPTMLKNGYEGLPELENSNEDVHKILSLGMAGHKERLVVKFKQYVESVRRHPLDCGSYDIQVAVLTGMIRNYQEHLNKHPKDKANKRRMLMAIDRRNCHLKYLKRTRLDRYELLCSQFGLAYVPTPEYNRRLSRRALAKKNFRNLVHQYLRTQKRLKIQQESKAQQQGETDEEPKANT